MQGLFSKKTEDVQLEQSKTGKNEWLYFRRTNPTAFEVYLADEEFKPSAEVHPVLAEINQEDVFSENIARKANDLLLLNLDDGWLELTTFEDQWVPVSQYENQTWDHQLVAKGKIQIT